MPKIETEYLEFLWPMRHYLISCGDERRPNIITLSFCMPVSKIPPMVACAVGREAYSQTIIRESGEFVINVPTRDMQRETAVCGFRSGRDIDKFKEAGLTARPARIIGAPIVNECAAHLECRVDRIIETGDKSLFIATVVEAYADEDLAKGRRKVEYAAGEFPRKIYGTRYPGEKS
jgi:flavin reductase (DIM6/NTAB) family NADH-FMN oxidoreductase RutF